MENWFDLWSLLVILAASFIIGWAAEAAQTFIPRALALSVLAWLQTLPEFAVEAAVAWEQKRDLMIANLTGSLRLIVGLGWPMIFFVHYFFHGRKRPRAEQAIRLDEQDSLGVFFLFISVLYFLVILAKGTLTTTDSVVLIAVYIAYLYLGVKLAPEDHEEEEDLPWVARQVVSLPQGPKIFAVLLLFVLGGGGLYVSVHPFLETLQKWALGLGISTFVFIQWVAPFLSEFPEKVSAFNWARQKKKAPMAVMNMVNSNINQWTMLAAMIPIVFNVSLGHWEPVVLDSMHRKELALTIAQSVLGGLLLLDMEFSFWDAVAIFVLWLAQFIYAPLRDEITVVYILWGVAEIGRLGYHYLAHHRAPRALVALRACGRRS